MIGSLDAGTVMICSLDSDDKLSRGILIGSLDSVEEVRDKSDDEGATNYKSVLL